MDCFHFFIKEKVTIKGFTRLLHKEKIGYSLQLKGANTTLSWEVVDARYVSYKKGSTQISNTGSFQIEFDVPDNANLGNHMVTFKNGIVSEAHHFQVQEFRTPEYRVSASINSGPFIANSSAIATVKADYFSGGGLGSAKAQWKVEQSVSSYRPPGHSSFSFQKTNPYWYYSSSSETEFVDTMGPIPFSGTTDPNGEHKICIEYSETDRKPKNPVTVTATVNVQDLNFQVMHASTNFLIHPSSLYVGIKSKSSYVKPNEPVKLSLVATTISGFFVENVAIKLKAIHHKVYRKKLETIKEDVVAVDLILNSKKEALEYDLVLKEGGKYTVTAEVCDKDGNVNSTGLILIVQGGSDVGTKSSRITQDNLTLICDKTSYQPGETAIVFVQSQYDEKAEGLLTVVCSGNLIQQRFELVNGSCILKVPISKEMIPNATVVVDLVSSDYRVDKFLNIDKNAPKKPAYASGSVSLSVPPLIHELKIEAKPKFEICLPGSSNEVEALVTDYLGQPVADSEVTLVVVDEAVLSLTGYSIQNPLNFFFQNHSPYYSRLSSRSQVFVKDWSSIQFEAKQESESESEDDDEEEEEEEEFGGQIRKERGGARMLKKKSEEMELEEDFGDIEGGETNEQPSQIKVRSNFCPLAVFATLKTDKLGKANFKFQLPDNLTEYRITVIAVSKNDKFGLGESSLAVNLPLMIRPSLPRFLNFGDKAEMSVILQNQSSNDLEVNFTINMTNLTLVDFGMKNLHVTIPPKKRVLVRYPVTTDQCGKGVVQIGAEVVGTNHSDAVTKEIPIFTPSTSEAFATYGEIDDGAYFQPILCPPDVYTQFGGLEVTTSSTAVQSLTDCFLYLVGYQFDCVEQASSRLLSICALQNVLYAFGVPGLPSKLKMTNIVKTGIKKLQNAQRKDGTYGFWNLDSTPNLYLSVHAAHCLQECVLEGYEVPSGTISQSLNFLTNIDKYLQSYTYSKWTKWTLQAKAIHVLTIMKADPNVILKKAKKLFEEAGDKLTMDALAWIMVAIFKSSKNKEKEVETILKFISNRAIESPETASFTTSFGENNDAQLVMLHSDRRTDAIVLDSLIEVDPKNSLIPKIVKGLMKHKVKGRWGNTSENIFILLAMKKYFETFEKIEPDFLVKMWMGEQFAGEQTFKGRSTDKNLINIPMSFIDECKEKENNFIIQKEGKGRLYYRLGMNYAPKNLVLDPMNYGFIVERIYKPVSNTEDVVLNKDGTWTFKKGELVKVELTMSTTQVRYHVALVDNLPAGLEALNPSLPIGGSENKQQSSSHSWWWGYWFEHQNFRDERVEAFSSYLYPSVHKYSYLARATTIGEFVIPPAKAEEMYSPEVFGRSKSERVFIK
jgi:alpha-2-macroglobulin